MEHGHRRRASEAGSGRDHISDLPDELMHSILCRLHSGADAARTSVLSRRWRRVWASLPELVLGNDLIHHGASFLDAVDDALAAYSAPHIQGLEINVPNGCHDVPARRVVSWLRFASRCLAGALRVRVGLRCRGPSDQLEPCPLALGEGDEVELPPCERVTSIQLWLGARFLLRLPPPPAGTFAVLSDLEISLTTVEGRALEALVSTQCPRLRKLSMWALTLVAASDVSVRSGTLRHLRFDVEGTLRLYISAPALQVLDVESKADDIYVVAPRLAEVVWHAKCAHFVFAKAGRHLRRLEVKRSDAMAPLMRRFDSVDELRLYWHYVRSIGCLRFLAEANNYLPKCQTLWVSSVADVSNHGFVPTVLHLLRRVNGIKKLVVLYAYPTRHPSTGCHCEGACHCGLPKSFITDNIVHDSLEEIQFDLMGGSADIFV